MPTAWRRAIFARLILIGFGLFLGSILTETLLQIGALFTLSMRGGQHEAPLGPGRRGVFVGDSNTFGLGVGQENSYPNVLGRKWDAARPEQRVETINLGTPGLNSSKLRQQFRGILTTTRPDLVAMMIGVNDWWTVPLMPYTEAEGRSWHYRLWSASRLYRLLFMLRRTLQNASETIATRESREDSAMQLGKQADLDWTGRVDGVNLVWKVDLRSNLERMIADARTVGVDVVLLTYPSEDAFHAQANVILRETAAVTQTPLIDLGAAFLRECPSRQCPELFLPDQHPTERGHELAAGLLWEHLTAAGRLQVPRATGDAVTAQDGASP